ncbi:hypothetical protein RRG08_018960 [Elysia crispata]|uniref:G-protein coupled receptors family 1 profile domain-containing protein n=1 Tax=Elysia crispata TaxID=231223 RepID=A0AAE1DTR7_9GAST|nr:hypothetical protein RRG08_018960 [Elysia crispata]
MNIEKLCFGVFAWQSSGLLIVSLYSLTAVIQTVQSDTSEPYSINNRLHISELSANGSSYAPISSSRPYTQVTQEGTKAETGAQSALSVHFLDTHSGKWSRWSLNYMLVPAVYLLGIFSNIVNISIFIKAGVKDGASVIFLSLSISDMLYSSFYLINRILRFLQFILDQHPYVRLAHLAFVIGPYSQLFFNVSILITLFAGVQKCACVAIPLTFRNFFTFRKSVVTLISIFACMVIYYLPRLCLSYVEIRHDPQFNRTRLMAKMLNFTMAITLSRIMKSVNRVSLPIVAELILIFCVCVMTYKLRQAAITRQSMTSSMAQEGKTADVKEGNASGSGSSLSKKELRVIRSVNIVCAVFVAGTAPRCIIEACDLAFKDFGDFSTHQSLYNFINSLQELIISLSIAANIIVYYKFNTKYRETFFVIASCFVKDAENRRK